jgi:hypothetical protein
MSCFSVAMKRSNIALVAAIVAVGFAGSALAQPYPYHRPPPPRHRRYHPPPPAWGYDQQTYVAAPPPVVYAAPAPPAAISFGVNLNLR